MIKKILYFHYMRSERDGSHVHTREFETAFGALCAAQGIAFKVFSPALVTPHTGLPTLLSRLRRRLAKFYLRDVKSLLIQLARSREERKVLRRERPDVVITRFDSYTLSILWACRREGIPVVIEVNEPEWDNMHAEYRQLPWLRRLFTNGHAMELADAAFAVSDEVSNPLRKFARGKPVETIPNGVDIARFDPGISGEAIRRQFDIGNDRVVFGFVGSFAPWHGLDMLVESVLTLIEEGLQVHLLLVGQPNYHWQALLDRLHSDRLGAHVTLAGFVRPKDIPPYLAAMDVAVLPNAAEYCSPLKLFEYMAMARLTVAAGTPPVAATLADGKEGLLFPVGDKAALTELLRQLASDSAYRRRLQAEMGQAARRRMESEFTWRHNAERVFRLAEAVCCKPGA